MSMLSASLQLCFKTRERESGMACGARRPLSAPRQCCCAGGVTFGNRCRSVGVVAGKRQTKPQTCMDGGPVRIVPACPIRGHEVITGKSVTGNALHVFPCAKNTQPDTKQEAGNSPTLSTLLRNR